MKGPIDFKGHRWVAVRSYNRNEDITEAVRRGLDWVEVKSGCGLNVDPILSGDFSGHQAINMAYRFGAGTILLLGYDCKGTHFFGKHPPGLNNPDPGRMAQWVKNLAVLAEDAKRLGVRIINCSPDSAVDCFEGMDIDAATRIGKGKIRRNIPRPKLSDGSGKIRAGV